MKLLCRYLCERRRVFLLLALFVIIFGLTFALYHISPEAVLYPALLCALSGCIALAVDFTRVKRRHERLTRIRTIADAADVLPEDGTISGGDYREIIRRMCQEHAAFSNEVNRRYSDMVDYYTVWAHQIKTPIAAMHLHLENDDSALSRRLAGELCRVEQYVEMVLAFLRLNSDNTDYVFRQCNLDDIVRRAVKKFSQEFILRKISLKYRPLNASVLTDEKWLSFVIEQVLSNALKYTPSGTITITLENEKTLRIRDSGIGIAPQDLPRIFENGYTGCNGRTDQSASGIGLYLCRRVCQSLGHSISADSTVGAGTVVDIDLAQYPLNIE